MIRVDLRITLSPIYITQAAGQSTALHDYLVGHQDLISGQVSSWRISDQIREITVHMTVAGEDTLDALIKGTRVLRLAFTELGLFQMFTSDITIATEV